MTCWVWAEFTHQCGSNSRRVLTQRKERLLDHTHLYLTPNCDTIKPNQFRVSFLIIFLSSNNNQTIIIILKRSIKTITAAGYSSLYLPPRAFCSFL